MWQKVAVYFSMCNFTMSSRINNTDQHHKSIRVKQSTANEHSALLWLDSRELITAHLNCSNTCWLLILRLPVCRLKVRDELTPRAAGRGAVRTIRRHLVTHRWVGRQVSVYSAHIHLTSCGLLIQNMWLLRLLCLQEPGVAVGGGAGSQQHLVLSLRGSPSHYTALSLWLRLQLFFSQWGWSDAPPQLVVLQRHNRATLTTQANNSHKLTTVQKLTMLKCYKRFRRDESIQHVKIIKDTYN